MREKREPLTGSAVFVLAVSLFFTSGLLLLFPCEVHIKAITALIRAALAWVRDPRAAIPILFLFLSLILYRAMPRRKEAASWILTITDSELAKRSMDILFESLRRKTELIKKKAYIIYIAKNGAYYLQLCAPGELRAYLQELLPQLEPEVRHVPGSMVDCPRERARLAGDMHGGPNLAANPLVHITSDPNIDGPEKRALIGVNEKGGRVFLRLEDFYRHVGVFGSTGSGKTTTCSTLAKRLARLGVRVVILDWHGEYDRLIPEDIAKTVRPLASGCSLNPFSMFDREELVDILEDVFDLTQPQSSVLSQILREGGQIGGLQELLSEVAEASQSAGVGREIALAIARRMEPLRSEEGERLFGPRNRFTLPEPGHVLILDLSEINSNRLRKLYSLTFLRLIYAKSVKESPLNLIVIIDEAHNMLPKASHNFIARMLAEVRKRGVGLVISTQSPSSINAEFLKNLNTKIIHRIVAGSDKRIIIESIGGNRELLSEISSLRAGEALLSAPEHDRPTKIKIATEEQTF